MPIDWLRKLIKSKKTFIITQKGEATVIVQDIKVYEKTQKTMAMLKLLVMTHNKSKKAKGIQKTFSELHLNLNLIAANHF